MSSSPPAKRARADAQGGHVELSPEEIGAKFHHTQLFVDSLKPIEEYKQLEEYLNQLAHKGSFDPFTGGMRFLCQDALPERVAEGRRVWEGIVPNGYALDPAKYQSHGQDVVEQLIAGLGWRVTAEYVGTATRSVLVTSSDGRGTKFVATAKRDGVEYCEQEAEPYYHFNKVHFDRFLGSHIGRPGVGVLGFEVREGAIELIKERYQKLHPKLIVHKEPFVYEDSRTISSGSRTDKMVRGTMKIFDVFAYYKEQPGSAADTGTVIRFSERQGKYGNMPGFSNPGGVLPGLEDIPARFNGSSLPCYSDHWVSNVRDRNGFLKVLQDTLCFTPKVNFNAGVVAAGEAIIESTVTGNNDALGASSDPEQVLTDQSQVYLPINNALSEVGHVDGFIKELGQGVQHLANRVTNLAGLIERVNNYRKITGRGFTFLNIPRSYYGFLVKKDLVKAGASDGLAAAMMAALEKASLVSLSGVVELHITGARIREVVAGLPAQHSAEFEKLSSPLIECVRRGRYSNLYSLLKDQLSESKYIQIVENKVLVDIQGQDILLQIFTSNICQREPGHEAPFIEFIERVCSKCVDKDGNPCPIKPGCGGFGIRNFLTLFLSIELSKSMRTEESARQRGDTAAAARATKEIDTLSAQMNESNPVLTGISDAMTAEAEALEDAARAAGAEKARLLAAAAEQRKLKEGGNDTLKEISERYCKLMAMIRTGAA